MFEYLASLCAGHELAWDCATGNGQAARSLAPFFDKILATDASEKQIGSAVSHPKIEYRVATAENPGIENASVDLVTVAQALHWLDIERFYSQVLRVLKPGGVLAVWSYERNRITPECNAVIENAYRETDGYWAPERKFVENHYRDFDMPLPEIDTRPFEMQLDWTAEDMLAYMRTWSGTQRYMKAKGSDPIALIEEELKDAWGARRRNVRWPLTLRICQKAT